VEKMEPVRRRKRPTKVRTVWRNGKKKEEPSHQRRKARGPVAVQGVLEEGSWKIDSRKEATIDRLVRTQLKKRGQLQRKKLNGC